MFVPVSIVYIIPVGMYAVPVSRSSAVPVGACIGCSGCRLVSIGQIWSIRSVVRSGVMSKRMIA